jgi:AcrR family transcriptional regulator
VLGVGRPKEFDVDEAVDAATQAFRDRGYEATSTQDLCDATGLCRSSIYHTFGSKRELFERSLTRYTERQTGELIDLLHADTPVPERLRALFDAIITAGSDGCFTVNSVVELAGRDDELTACALRGMASLRGELRCAIEAGQAAGEIRTGSSPDELADFVQATVAGLQVMARGGVDGSAMRHAANVALAAM